MNLRRNRIVRIDDGANSVVTLGDNSPVTIYRGETPQFSLHPLKNPDSVPNGSGPAVLMAARHELVDYVGRVDERSAFSDWLNASSVRSVRSLTAVGGQGKTRFSLQVAREAAADGWQVLLARHVLDGGILDYLGESQVPASQPLRGVLIVVDYADRWDDRDLFDLLVRPESSGYHFRVLLLGRSDIYWPTLARQLRMAGVATSQAALKALAEDDGSRHTMFEAAVRAYAILPECGGPTEPERVERPNLSDSGFASTLAIQMAALVAVLRTADEGSRSELPTSNNSSLDDPAAASRELLVREVRHWERMQGRVTRPLTLSIPAMTRTVLVATLTRGLSYEKASRLLGQLKLGDDSRTLIDDHALCYPVPSRGYVLEALYPDRLGEDFIAAVLPGAPADSDSVVPLGFLADAGAVPIVNELAHLMESDMPRVSVWTVLIETARRWPHVGKLIAPWLEKRPELIVECGSVVLARAAGLESLASALPGIGSLLDATIGGEAHLELSIGAAAVQQQIVNQFRAGNSDRYALAQALHTLSVRIAAIGGHQEALGIAQEAVQCYRELLPATSDSYLPDYARSLRNLASRLAIVGRGPEALVAADEAINYLQDLVRLDRTKFLPDLARALDTGAICLAREGYRAEALAIAEKAVDVLRELTEDNRSVFLSDLAAATNNLGLRYSEEGRYAESVDVAREAVELYTELASEDPNAHLMHLAAAKDNLASRLAGTRRRAEAVRVAREAADIYRVLVMVNRAAFLPEYAMSLNNLSIHLSYAKLHEEALAASMQAVKHYRELVELNRGAYLVMFSGILSNLAARLEDLAQFDDALEVATEAVALGRELVAANRKAHLYVLALSTNNLANHLAAAGADPHVVVGVAKEAVALRRELTLENRNANLANLALSVRNLAVRLRRDGQRFEALQAAAEAVHLYDELDAIHPGIFDDDAAVASQIRDVLEAE